MVSPISSEVMKSLKILLFVLIVVSSVDPAPHHGYKNFAQGMLGGMMGGMMNPYMMGGMGMMNPYVS